MGRPLKGALAKQGGEARMVSTSIRFQVDEHLRLKKAATKAHLSISDYIRTCLPDMSRSNYPTRKSRKDR